MGFVIRTMQPFHLLGSAAQKSHSCSRPQWKFVLSELGLEFSYSRSICLNLLCVILSGLYCASLVK